MKKQLYAMAAVVFAAAVISGCGGKSGMSSGRNATGYNAPSPAAATGSGKVAAAVRFTGRAGGRQADLSATSTVDIVISISGVYSGTGKEFKPVVTVYKLDLSKGHGQAQLAEVPVGVNHLLTASVNWGNATETVMTIIPAVEKDKVTVATANEESTVVAHTAIYFADTNNIKLNEVKQAKIDEIAAAVHSLSAYVPFYEMTPEAVFAYQANMGKPGTVTVLPEMATAVVGIPLQFVAVVADANGFVDSNATAAWSVSGNIGTISAAGVFTATATGSATVTAVSGSLTGTTVVAVEAAPVLAACGNGMVEPGETCDDGNAVTETCAYGQTSCTVCNSTCQTATGTVSFCGDGQMNGTETCDDGNAVTETCAYGQTTCTVCDSTCHSAAGTVSLCGDGQVNGTETCDDGNAVTEVCAYGQTSCTVCNSTCQSAAGAIGGFCGDGITQSANGESCDDGNVITENCPYGQTSCTVCGATCSNVSGAVSGYCGDGTTQTGNGETCDSGASNGQPNMCNATCNGTTGTTCGNGVTEAGEACDDGNTTTETCTYGQTSCTVCNSTCQNAAGSTSTCGDGITDTGNGETCDSGASNGQPNMCNATCNGTTASVCGNTVVEAGEACDDGASNGQANMCNATCTGITGSTCGNAVVEAGEACDDGNTTTEACAYGLASCTVCNNLCQNAAGAASFCGDGATQAGNGETCDDGNTVTEVCTYGQTSCTVCNSVCQNAAGAVTGYCGDSITQSGNGETCDTGAGNGQPNQCNATCNGTTASVCGNAVVEAGEACDDGNTSTEACAYGQTSCTVCNSVCQNAAGAVTGYCGDSITQSGNGETCDDGASNGQPNMCNATCNGTTAAVCGNSVVEAGEVCDTASLGGQTCASQGFDGGTLSCNGTCLSFNTSGCALCGNGVTEAGETCDDSNTVTESCAYGQTSCTVCDATCQNAAGALTGFCGDGVTQGANGETCDDSNTVTEVCAYGQTSCTVCNATCQSVAGALTGFCGDGVTQGANGETCDDSNAVTEVCAYGQTSCTVCNATCQNAAGTLTGFCGDGIVQGGNGETCDSGGSNGQMGQCNNTCNGVIVPVCGNNAVEPGEECDDGNGTKGDGCSQYCFSEIAPSMEHVCAMNKGYNEGAECWGRNHLGQLGDGTTTNRQYPVPVAGLTGGVRQVKTGQTHGCVLTNAGGVKCWGYNGEGELGNGNFTNYLTPVDVSGLTSGVKQISAGGAHSCALLTTGEVRCWGYNAYGQIGSGGGNSSVPVSVPGLSSGVAYVAAYSNNTCALLTTGGVKCWGRGNLGANGDGAWAGSSTPLDVVGLATGVVAISSGNVSAEHACALLGTGGVKCWGANALGQVGNGANADVISPVDVVGLTSGVKNIVGEGYQHTCVTMNTGGAKCWGNNAYGTLGDSTNTHSNVPVDVTVATGTVAVISGSRTTTCLRKTTGEIYCMGDNSFSQNGNPGAPMLNYPGLVVGGSYAGPTCGNGVVDAGAGETCDSGVNNGQLLQCDITCMGMVYPDTMKKVSIGDISGCAVVAGGSVKCWGNNVDGQLGIGNTTNSITPVYVTGLSSMTLVSMGHTDTACSIDSAGGLKCWGHNAYGSVGNGTTIGQLTPVAVTGLGSGVVQSTNGAYSSCALTNTGGVKCWGYNYYGELGNGTSTDSNVPVDVTGLTSGVVQIAGRAWVNCALLSNGAVMCWGEGGSGQLGNGTVGNSTVPVYVTGFSAGGASAVAAGYNSACLLTTGGGVKCWGGNNAGQLGDGTVTNTNVPVDVSGLTSGVAAISVGWRSACALLNTGEVRCWGENTGGQLGDGTTTNSSVPVTVSGLTSGVTGLYMGSSSVCAIQNGQMKCWGTNGSGQIGDGTTTLRLTPVNVNP